MTYLLESFTHGICWVIALVVFCAFVAIGAVCSMIAARRRESRRRRMLRVQFNQIESAYRQLIEIAPENP